MSDCSGQLCNHHCYAHYPSLLNNDFGVRGWLFVCWASKYRFDVCVLHTQYSYRRVSLVVGCCRRRGSLCGRKIGKVFFTTPWKGNLKCLFLFQNHVPFLDSAKRRGSLCGRKIGKVFFTTPPWKGNLKCLFLFQNHFPFLDSAKKPGQRWEQLTATPVHPATGAQEAAGPSQAAGEEAVGGGGGGKQLGAPTCQHFSRLQRVGRREVFRIRFLMSASYFFSLIRIRNTGRHTRHPFNLWI